MPAVSDEGDRPFKIVSVATGEATDWAAFTFPRWVRVVGVQNQGTGLLFVGRDETGAHPGVDTAGQGTKIAADELVPFAITAGRERDNTAGGPRLSIFGADGAGHLVGLILQENQQ